jgi:hypothetical protein
LHKTSCHAPGLHGLLPLLLQNLLQFPLLLLVLLLWTLLLL